METQHKHLILVTGDNADHYMIEKYILIDKYEVAHAVDGLDVIEKFEQIHPNLIVIDTEMPNLNGIEVMKRIKQKHPDLPIVGITSCAYGGGGVGQMYLSYSFDAFFVKPIKREEFLEQIGTLLNCQ